MWWKAMRISAVVLVIASSVGQCIDIPGGAALLMAPVGKSLPRTTVRSEVKKLFVFLWHLHAENLVHGDPRVPNVMLDGEKPLWIDFVNMGKASPNLRKLDAEILTRSILHVSREMDLGHEMENSLKEYGTNSSLENINVLANEVCQFLNLPN
ncbi:Aste57867_14129 [Aphanomyces stellatus]|uniref:Aste57867_14129 protein n=1 Tax=Aphanomyces stellatus TaxID=120398 RepID=A0A485L247_9STRA|nr:hypothetical protein As57867_014078 [Aphanomyces stellatus]VFT90956.1 Aste57867_14129 [Aphanomyces stellatus]